MEPKQVFRAYEGAEAQPAAFCLKCGAGLSDREDGGRTRRACASCGFVHYTGPAAAVAVLVVGGNRILLCRRRADVLEGGKWCLPCGYVEYDEDYLTAAHREVQEETGLAVEIRGIISVCSNFLRPDVHTVVTVLVAQPIGGEPTPGDDIELVRWFPSAGALPDMAFEADRHIITRFFASRLEGAPVDRQHARRNWS
ncbi:MAG: NUDIX domain-containing protein [Chloroflexi bacterium]|nr:NUDIX domain-containing protein [Chloroflexota bacterium]